MSRRISPPASPLPRGGLGWLLADVSKGAFGGNPALQLLDFQAGASRSSVLSITNNPVGSWYSKPLAGSYFGYINKAGVTQFRLRFTKDDNNNLKADYLRLYSGDSSAAYRPRLVIQYYLP